jgi:hypothetical protein
MERYASSYSQILHLIEKVISVEKERDSGSKRRHADDQVGSRLPNGPPSESEAEDDGNSNETDMEDLQRHGKIILVPDFKSQRGDVLIGGNGQNHKEEKEYDSQ